MRTALFLIGMLSIVTSCVMVAGQLDTSDNLNSTEYITRGIMQAIQR
jgi:hypothetical protein